MAVCSKLAESHHSPPLYYAIFQNTVLTIFMALHDLVVQLILIYSLLFKIKCLPSKA